MTEFKVCAYCGRVPISNIREDSTDYYSHIRIKYCDTCRAIVKKQQTAKRVQALRQRKREENALIKSQNELLKRENELIKQNIEEYLQLINFVREQMQESKKAQ